MFRTKSPMLPQMHMEVNSLILAEERLSILSPEIEKICREYTTEKREKKAVIFSGAVVNWCEQRLKGATE